jgi:two-component system KDP operon response regulator KdpE
LSWCGLISRLLPHTARAIEGIKLCRQISPDIVIMDLGLPDMDGPDIVREIRSFSEVPIFIASARDIDEIPRDILKMGHVEYFAKPFDLGGFMEKLGTILDSDPAKRD